MNVSPDVNFDELARSTDDFNAAQLKAVRKEFKNIYRFSGGDSLIYRLMGMRLFLLSVSCSPLYDE